MATRTRKQKVNLQEIALIGLAGAATIGVTGLANKFIKNAIPAGIQNYSGIFTGMATAVLSVLVVKNKSLQNAIIAGSAPVMLGSIGKISDISMIKEIIPNLSGNKNYASVPAYYSTPKQLADLRRAASRSVNMQGDAMSSMTGDAMSPMAGDAMSPMAGDSMNPMGGNIGPVPENYNYTPMSNKVFK